MTTRKSKCNSKNNSNSRFPTGMTERKASARTTAKATTNAGTD
jgi:hypothetical protein